MELKEYLKLVKNNQKILWITTLVFVIIIPGFFWIQSQKKEAEINLDISRLGTQETSEYQFDDFYRLQADEKFADTVVEWLKSPTTTEEIWAKAYNKKDQLGLNELAKIFHSEKMSAQIVKVSFSVQNEEEAKSISRAIFSVVEKNTNELNEKQQKNNWFQIILRGPTVREKTINWLLIIPMSFLLGIFIGFWVILFKHYLK